MRRTAACWPVVAGDYAYVANANWTLLSFWAHPERVLDPVARAGTSGFARLPAAVTRRATGQLRRDLATNTLNTRNGRLRAVDAYDAGLRLIVAHP